MAQLREVKHAMRNVRALLAASDRARARDFAGRLGEGFEVVSDAEVAAMDEHLGGWWARAEAIDAGEPVDVAGWELASLDESLRYWWTVPRARIEPDGTVRDLQSRANTR